MTSVTRNTSDQNEVFATQFNMQEQLNQMMLMLQEANQRNKESTKALKKTEAAFKIQIEELRKENAELKDMITKPMQAEYQVENARPIEDEAEQNKREVVYEAEIHFDLARLKMGEQLVHQMNLGKDADDHSN